MKSGIISVIASRCASCGVAIHKFCGSERGVYIGIVAGVCKEQWAYRWAWRNPKEPQKWGEKGAKECGSGFFVKVDSGIYCAFYGLPRFATQSSQ